MCYDSNSSNTPPVYLSLENLSLAVIVKFASFAFENSKAGAIPSPWHSHAEANVLPLKRKTKFCGSYPQ